MKISNMIFILMMILIFIKCNQEVNNINSSNIINSNNVTSERFSYVVKNIECDDNNCSLNNGVCIDFNTCSCKKGYVHNYDNNKKFNETIQNSNDSNIRFCEYKMKSTITAFILELIIPLGIGHFYSGNYLMAVFKFLLTICICLLCSLALVNKEDSKIRIFITIIIIVSTLGFFAWHIYDLYSYITNKYTDYNDFPMY